MKGPIIAMLLSFCLILCSFAGSLLYTGLNIQASDHKWCHTLQTLTAQKPPSPAKGNPSRIFANQLYQELTDLERQFQC